MNKTTIKRPARKHRAPTPKNDARSAPRVRCAGSEKSGHCKSQARGEALRARTAHVMELALEFMPSREFTYRGAADKILGKMPEVPENARPRKARQPEGLPPYLASLYEVPLLTKEQEQYLFRKYNFLKYRASKLRSQLDADRPDACLVEEIERLHAAAVDTKNQIIRANLRLVVAIAKKHARPETLFDMVSDGNVSLMRAVEKFDYSMGFKFSTYATWAIKNNFAREYMVQARHADRFHTGLDEPLNWMADSRSDSYQQERMHERRQAQVNRVLDCLNDREREIIKRRFGLQNHPGQTLQEVGAEFGISKERIRQIETRALAKLREAASTELSETL